MTRDFILILHFKSGILSIAVLPHVSACARWAAPAQLSTRLPLGRSCVLALAFLRALAPLALAELSVASRRTIRRRDLSLLRHGAATRGVAIECDRGVEFW